MLFLAGFLMIIFRSIRRAKFANSNREKERDINIVSFVKKCEDIIGWASTIKVSMSSIGSAIPSNFSSRLIPRFLLPFSREFYWFQRIFELAQQRERERRLRWFVYGNSPFFSPIYQNWIFMEWNGILNYKETLAHFRVSISDHCETLRNSRGNNLVHIWIRCCRAHLDRIFLIEDLGESCQTYLFSRSNNVMPMK